MFFIFSKLLAFLINPLLWIFLLLIFASINKKKRKSILYIILVSLYILCNSFIADQISRLWEIPRFDPEDRYDVGIVLGGISEYDKITNSHNFNKYADRLIDAKELYHKGVIEKIMLTGGNGMLFNDGYVEADAMREHLIKNKIPIEDIIIEKRSRNTLENALNSADILNKLFKNGEFLIITSAQHMRRAKFCFDKTSIKTTCFPTDCSNTNKKITFNYLIVPKIEALEIWSNLIHEWVGYIAYKIFF